MTVTRTIEGRTYSFYTLVPSSGFGLEAVLRGAPRATKKAEPTPMPQASPKQRPRSPLRFTPGRELL